MTPLYLHASVGLGKTHLLQAIAHAAIARRQSVVYLTAETFMYGFVNALRSQSAIAFKEQLRSIDLLIFDDAQFLQGRVIQNEFGHVLSGTLRVVVGFDEFVLEPGDSITFPSSTPHRLVNDGEETVRARLRTVQELFPIVRARFVEQRMFDSLRLLGPAKFRVVGQAPVAGRT